MVKFEFKPWGIRLRKALIISLIAPLLSVMPQASATSILQTEPNLKVAPAIPKSASVVADGLIARFDSRNPNSYSGSGSTWNSLSSGQPTATLFNSLGTSVQNAGGSSQPVMAFAANSKYADINLNMNDFSSGFSASFYANFGTAHNWERIFDIGAGEANNNIFVAREGTTNNFIFEILDGGTARRCFINSGISNSTWNHWVVTYNGTACTIYKDGVLQSFSTYGSAAIRNVVRANGYIGRSNWGVDSYFEGFISDIAFYNGILDQSQVNTNRTMQTGAPVTVTMSANGGSGTPTTPTVYSNFNGNYTLSTQGTVSNGNYVFSGWNTATNGLGTNYSEGTSFTTGSSTTLHARWQSVITYNSNNGTGSATASSATVVGTGATTTLPGRGTLSRSGFTFRGWNTAANGSGINYPESGSFTVAGSQTLYAQWNSTIQYDPNTATTTRAIESTTAVGSSANTTLSSGQLVKGSPISNGLVLHLDASDASTVSGSSWANKVAGVAGAEASATLVNSPTYNAAEGAFSLNGSSQFFTLGTTNYLFNGALPFTLNLSFKASDPNKDNCLIGNFNGGVGATHMFRLQNSVLNANRNVSPWQVTGTGQIPAGEIVYASYSFDGSYMRVYLNGSLYVTSALINNSVSYNGGTRIGACRDSNVNSRFFKGQIYNAQIYNRALSESEISTNFDNLLPNRLVAKSNFTLGGWNTQSNGTGTTFGSVSTDLAALPTPFFRVSAENYSGGTLSASVGGSNLSITKNGSPVLNTNSGGGFGANARFPTISGATGDGFRLGNAEIPNYTFCGMARYKDQDSGVRSTRGRIFAHSSLVNWISGWYGDGTRNFFHDAWLVGHNTVSDPNWHVVCDSGNRVFWDGVKQTVTQQSYTSLPPLAINWAGSNDNSHFEFTEAIVYNQALSDAEINVIFRYFENKFGLTNITTTASHATKFVPPSDYSSQGDTTLQATWVSQVTYDGNKQTSGSAPAPQVITNAGATVAAVGTLARSGFVFTGWNTAADGSGTRFTPGAALTNDGNKLLYAQWVLPVSLAAGAINPATLNPYMRLVASDYDATNKVWRDSSGNSRNVTRVIGSPTLVTTTGNGATKSFQTIAGGTADKFYFDNDPISTNWTVFALSRFSGANNRNRIISGNYAADAYQDSSGNWLFGQYGGKAGLAHYNAWVSPDSTPAGLNLTDWVMSTAYPFNYRYNGIARGTSGGTAELPPLGINTFTGQQSDYQVAEVIIFNRTLTLSEIRQIEDYFDEKYGLSYQKVGIYQNTNTAVIGAGVGGRSETFTATNGLGTKTFTNSPSRSGITLDTSTANSVVLVVSPIVATGDYVQTITATDAAGETATHVITVTVSPAVKFDTSTATTLITTHRKGATLRLNTLFGVGTKVFTMTPVATGISLDTSTAASGFATLRVDTFTATGTFTQSITVTDDTKLRSTYSVTISINAPPTISSTSAIVTSPVFDSLRLNLDAGDRASYAGTGRTWTDLSSSRNNAIWQVDPTWDSATGGIFNLNGSSQYAKANTVKTDVFTVEAWARFNTLPNTHACLVTDEWQSISTPINYAICFWNNGKIRAGYWTSATDWITTGEFTPVINTWYHFSYSVSKVNSNYIGSLYVNGSLATTTSSSPTAPTSSEKGTRIGLRWDGTAQIISGAIPVARIYNRALTTSEITQNYNALLPRFTNNPSNAITITTTESVTASSSIFYAGLGTGNKTFALSNATAGISIDTATANTVRVNLANTLSATSTTAPRSISQVITATDTSGVAAATPVYVTTVINPKIIITDATLGNLSTTFGRVAYDTFTATQGTGLKTFTVVSSSFPSAFTMTNPSSNVGLLTVANNLPAGTYTLTITATDTVGATTNFALTVVVNPVPTIAGATGNTLTTTLARSGTLRINVVGGTGTRTIAWTSPQAGITLDTSTLAAQNFITLSASSAVPVRSYSFSIAATDSSSARVSDTFTVIVNRWPVIGSDSVVQNGLAVNLEASTYSGTGNWLDTSGAGRNASGATASTTPAGTAPEYSTESGGIFSFNEGAATTNHMLIPNPGTLETFTVSTWVRFKSIPTNNAAIITQYWPGGSNTINYVLAFSGGSIYGAYYRGGSNWTTTTTLFTPVINTWYHLSYLVYKSGANYFQDLYVNGVKQGASDNAGTIAPSSNGSVISLARRWDNNANVTLNGAYGNVSIYNRALSASEILQNYNATGARYISTNSGRETVTVTQGVSGAISSVLATQGTGTKTFTTTNANAGVTIDTSTANAFTLNLANTLTSTSATVARTITETVTATDAAGATTARVYSVVVNPPVRVESTTGTITTTSGIVAWDTFTATQGTGNKVFTLAGTPSIAGFTMTQSSNRAVLKVETTVNPGTYTLTITATDEVGAVASITKTVVVNAQPTISGFANIAGTTGYAFSSQNYSAANGTGTLTFSITTVPFTLGRNTSGITLSAIVGSPTINVASGVEADTYTVTVRVTDSVTAFGTFVVTLRVNPVATLSGSRSLTKVYGEDLSQVYTTSGGTQPFNLFSSSICTSEKSTFVGNGTNGSNGVTYTVEKFNGTGDCSWVAPANVSNASILVVAGGGGGGSRHSGGGGGGGVMYATNYSLTPGSSYALSVGNGGTGYVGGTSSGSGNSGQNSFFGGSTGSTSIVATGGGGSNANGGSGGGSNYHLSAAGTATPGSTAGNARSAGSSTMTINGVVATVIAHGQSGAIGLGSTCKTVSNSNGWCGGGGGGASSAGSIPATVSGNQFRAGNGGNGVALDFTGSSTTYAGGGGGGAGSDTSPYGSASACFSDSPREGYGGTGGGGNGSKCLLAATNGTDGLGGGGGGGGYAYYGDSNQNARGGNGGSGTVIVRYVTPAVDTQTARITMDTLAQTPAGLVRLNAPRLLAVGTYTQTITVRDSALNPVTTNATVTLTVNKATPTLTLSLPGAVTTAKYGSPVTISAVATTAGTVAFVNGSSNITGCTAVATSAGLATCSWTPTAVGATTLRATLTPTDTANYNSSAQVNLAITVAKADTLTVTVLSQSETFTGSTIVATRAFTTTGLAAIDSLTAISMLFAGTANDGNAYSNTTAPTNAGTYLITPNYPANAAAYTFGVGSLGTTSAITNYESVTVVSGTLTVRRAPQVMSFTFANSNSVTYSPTATLISTATTRLGTGTRTYSTTTPLICSINETATITVLQAGSCSAQMAVALTANYEADTATQVVTINKAFRTFDLTPAVSTLKYAETTTVTATLSGGALDGTISYTLGSPAGCTFDPLTGELLATSGTVQCPLTATISEGINYLAETSTAISLTIAKANAPVITIDTVTALSHIPNTRASIVPTFTVTGLKNLDTANSLTYTYGFVSNPFETFAYSDTRTPIDAGTYSITPSALTLSTGLMSNYETPTYAASAINVVINRINQESVTIQSVNGDVEVPFALIATGGSTNGALSFTKVSGANCSITGTTLTATQAGSCMVTVTRAGNRNYLPFTSESVTVRVRNFVIVDIVVPANPNSGITIAPTVPVVKGPDVCTTGCVPTITSANTYDVSEGDLIVLTGTNFLTVTKVYFNIYTEGPNFIADSDTQISVRVPADLPLGDATIEVVSPGGTSNRLFDFIILP